jgi:hypothetical protein
MQAPVVDTVTLEEIQRAVEALGSYHFEDLSKEEQEALVDWIDEREKEQQQQRKYASPWS